MRGPLSRRRLVPASPSRSVVTETVGHGAAIIADGQAARPSTEPATGDVCLVHVTEDGSYAARLRDTLEAFGISVSTENVSMLDADSPRLRAPQRLVTDRHRLTVILVSDAFELFHVLNASASQAFLQNLAGAPDRCLMAVLDDVQISELAPLRAAAVINRLREPSELLVAIKNRLDSLERAEQPRVPERDAVGSASASSGDDLGELVKHKPSGWRTTLQAAVMVDELHRLEGKRYEHSRGRTLPGLTYGRYEASNFLQGAVLPDLEGFLQKFSRQISVIKSNAYTEDAARIERSARDLVGLSEQLLDWAARIRGTAAPRSWAGMLQCAAALSDSMLASVDEFVHAYSVEAQRLRDEDDYDGENVSIVLTFDLDSVLLERLLSEYKKVHRG